MSGTKGHSGRKGAYHELDIKTLLNKSYSIMMSFLSDETITNEKKASFATAFLSKRVGEKIDITIEHQLTSHDKQALIDTIAKYLPQRIS